ncbi:hypothetical protein ACQPU1_00955 [Clostridium paraputrificum]|uniref:hypothetical protein n=1 Tax=Clostridium TaxID=1485 RepID=UPI003D3451E7
MRSKVILLKYNKLIYKGLNYEIKDFIKEKKSVRNRVMYLLDEDLYIKKYIFDKKNKIDSKDINRIIEEAFGLDEDYLFHYTMNRKRKELSIYAIKGGRKVSKLCENIRKVKIIPIQLEMLKKIKRKIKDKSWGSIFSYKDSYYFISVKDGIFNGSFVERNLEYFLVRIKEFKGEEPLYFDSRIGDINIKNVKELDFGGIINDKALYKERFFT